ncbi:MAG: hypothetical protein CM15mP77_0660 [Synechococcus sp.]|nr:MAG: hypothetical protein CM15mP77_0660 [Synechococcus sp.]
MVFHDGQGLIVPADSGVATLADLNGKAICVGSGTTRAEPQRRFASKGIPYTPIKYQDLNQVVGGYLQGRCQAMTSDRSQLAAARSGFDEPNAHVILEDRLSKEPLAPAVVGGDQRFVDATTWVIYALIEAEERGITQANSIVSCVLLKRIQPGALRRFLGVDAGLGRKLGLPMISSCRPFGPRQLRRDLHRHLGPQSPVAIPAVPTAWPSTVA